MKHPVLTAGFTLIELCLVLALFAILAGAAVPSLTGMMSRVRIQGVLGGLSSDLYLARSLAARQNRPLSVRFLPSDGCADAYEIVADDGAVLRRVTTAASTTGVCLGSNVARAMHVNSRGMLVGSPRTIRARSGSSADSVTVSIAGRVYRWP